MFTLLNPTGGVLKLPSISHNFYTDIPPPVSDPGLEIKGDFIYLQGGEILTENGIEILDGLWRYSIKDNEWEKLEPEPDLSPSERDAQVFARHGNKLWMFGGDVNGDEFFNLRNDTWVYSISQNKWTQVHAGQAPPASKRNAYVFVGDYLYVFVNTIGFSGIDSVDTLEVWRLKV